MPRGCFCTIITANYLPYARAMVESIQRFGRYEVKVFVADGDPGFPGDPADPSLLYREQVCTQGLARTIATRYPDHHSDEFRWSMKPALLEFLLVEQDYDRVCCVDWDLFFYRDPGFLLEQLGNCAVLLSPHYRSSDPEADAWNFELNFRDGVFNGGFVGASKAGLEAMRWWARACAYRCEVDFEQGLYVDQKYLDLLHSRFEGVEVIRHRGCNVAEWNRVDCDRMRSADGEVLIHNGDPIVFIHFDTLTVREILVGRDPLLVDHLREYQEAIKRHDPGYRDAFERKEELLARKWKPPRSTPKRARVMERIRRKASSLLTLFSSPR
jgi:hypothetical protein